MNQLSLRDILEHPLAKDPHFLSWLEARKEVCGIEAFETYEKVHKNENSGRVFIEGAFDVVHSGHYNAIRQAKVLARTLVIGVNSDADIAIHKGPPVMNVEERAILVGACKWTDEVVAGTPYLPTLELLDQVNCQFVSHGDDIILGADGRSIYTAFEEVGRMM